jgi:hypothetical protein
LIDVLQRIHDSTFTLIEVRLRDKVLDDPAFSDSNVKISDVVVLERNDEVRILIWIEPENLDCG